MKSGFVFTVDALICVLITVGISANLGNFLDHAPSLERELLFQQAQDAFEVCALVSNDFVPDGQCIGSTLGRINGKLNFCFQDGCENKLNTSMAVEIRRIYIDGEVVLRVWAT